MAVGFFIGVLFIFPQVGDLEASLSSIQRTSKACATGRTKNIDFLMKEFNYCVDGGRLSLAGWPLPDLQLQHCGSEFRVSNFDQSTPTQPCG